MTTVNPNQPTEELHKQQKTRLINEIMKNFYALSTAPNSYEKDFIERTIRFNFEFLGRMECNYFKTLLEKEIQAAKEAKEDEKVSES